MPSGSIFSPRLRGVAHGAGATELSDGCQGSHRANPFAPGKGKEPKEKKEKSEKRLFAGEGGMRWVIGSLR
jgi:hypothetical protein